ncbi:branched-chain amino acid ABC transporter ATP-binding protein/permease [Achromobacter denitrificans]|uniref:branched-chain amino acid ABC transporter ATP-binding protein/permease n=1 Tax=Achromobacter denitrificans TaxID=32002 RepID=UPI000F4EE7A4|nr:branched-chain amino acid ABC transporter ATP-binding protein/permease [Achromobacter denitrificans]QCS67057.1 branched-chain amino acid ABC transporter ATP-binding protein/permease [Achromobacter denitrificans]RSE75636.1 ATP-binding cassette domain-containing protein [Achromobacter denitrificans]
MKPEKLYLSGAALAVAALILLLPTYYVGLLTLAGTNALVCLGLAFLLAAGQLSLGHAAFLGGGAYASAILARDYGVPPPLAIALAVAACAAAAYVIGRLTLRLRGHYLPLATLAWGIAAYVCLVAATDLTGGASGLSDIPPPRVFGLEFGTRGMGAVAWIAVGLAFIAYCRIYRGRMGRAARAIKASPTMAAAFGVDVAAAKIRIFVLSAALAALAGGIYAFYMSFLSPTSFSIGVSFNLLIMVVLGGCLHPLGPLLGVLAFTAIELGAQYLIANLLGIPGQMETMLFGLILIVALLRWPNGLLTWVRLKPPSRPAAPDEAEAAPHPVSTGQRLSVDAVHKRFGGLQALKDVTLDIPPGRITGLIGPNGAGKSTLFNVMTAVLPASGGRVALDGDALPARAHEVVRRGVARSFQHVQLVPELTVLDNVLIGGHIQGKAGLLSAALGLDRAEERRLAREARAALELVGLADQALRPAASLTLGSQRLVEVARALMARPGVLLLDEPAAGLRGPEKAVLVQLMRKLRDERGMAVLLVEHDMELVMGCVDYLFVLNYGALLAQGERQDVQRNPAVVAAYLGAEA